MKFLDALEIEDKRGFEKACLLKYVDEIILNKFESSVSNSLLELEKELNLEYENLMQSVNEFGGGNVVGVYEKESQLYSIYEMKIIYLFKSLEINLKKLLSITYAIDTSKRYDWKMLMEILTSKGIDFSKIKCHQQIENIRKVNNFLKHSTQAISSEVEKIKEFKDLTSIQYEDLEKFYNNMKKFPQKWIQDLGDKIYSELYTFDNNRLKIMAQSIAVRMNENDAKLFIANLKALYDTP